MAKWFRIPMFLAFLSLVVACSASKKDEHRATNEQFNIGIDQEFETLNPIIHQMAASVYMYSMTGRVLTAINPDWKWQCFLCTEIPTLENGKARIEKIGGVEKVIADWEIREDAKWGDGTPITGHDVELSWKIGSSPNVTVGEKEVYDQMERIDVDEKNPRKFRVTYREKKYNYYHLGTFYIVPKHLEGPVFEKTKDVMGAYEKQTTFATNPENPGLYSGPYVVKEIKLGSHLVLERNPHFYGSQAKIKRIVFRVIPNTQALEANILSGSIDMTCEIGGTLDQALALERRIKADPELNKKLEVRYRQGTIYEHVDLNLRNPFLKDVRVRKALVYALDRDQMVHALFEGKNEKALHNIHPLDPYFTSDVPKYPYDLEKAKALLDEAGWTVGDDGYRTKDGKRLSFTIMTTAGNKTREQVQVFIQSEWKKAGIELKIKNEPARVFFGETVRKAKYPDMAMYAWVSSPDNPPLSTIHSSNIPTPENAYNGQNSGGYKSEAVDAALDAIKTEFDFNKRKALMAEVQKHYAEDVPVIPLYMRVEIATVPKNLSGFRISGHQFYSTLFVEDWNLDS